MSETTEEVTDFEKHIYNRYLAVSRGSQGKPYKLRKDFSNFADDSNYFYIKKLSMFFNRFKHIDIEEFFKAPFSIYNDQLFDLKFYTSQRALKVYTLFNQRKQLIPPDHDDQLYGIKKSLQYILRFCNNNNIDIDDYISHTDGGLPSFVMHLKHCNVTVYTLFGFEDFERVLGSIDRDHLKFTLGELVDNIPQFRTRFMTSTLAKKLVRSGVNKLKEIQITVES